MNYGGELVDNGRFGFCIDLLAVKPTNIAFVVHVCIAIVRVLPEECPSYFGSE
jgi:hypothetical protein